jgi:hypothetical protein
LRAARIILARTAITRSLAGDGALPGFFPGADHDAAMAGVLETAAQSRITAYRVKAVAAGIGVWPERNGRQRTRDHDPSDAGLFLTWADVAAVIALGCGDGNLDRYMAAVTPAGRRRSGAVIIRDGCERTWLQPGPDGLPDAAEVTAAVRELIIEARAAGQADPLKAANRLLDRYKPAIGQLADVTAAAAWLGVMPRTIHREKERVNVKDGSPRWPESDGKYGRSDVWTYRSIVLARAQMPPTGRARKE